MSRFKTEEEKQLWLNKVRKTKMERYGNLNYNNMSKNRQTKLERYGDAKYNNFEKSKETCLKKYGVEHPNQCKEIKDKISKSKLTKETQQTIWIYYPKFSSTV